MCAVLSPLGERVVLIRIAAKAVPNCRDDLFPESGGNPDRSVNQLFTFFFIHQFNYNKEFYL